MYKVFNQNQTIIFTENLTKYKLSDRDLLYKIQSIKKIIPVYQEFIHKKTHQKLIYFITNKICIDNFFNKFLSHFKFVEAAGGLITNKKNELLLIYRLGKWDLPKGKIKKNENIIKAATRECIEETGIEELTILKTLENTYHIYNIKNQELIKKTHWFFMKSTSEKKLKPQIEENIEKLEWMNQEKVKKSLENTYESLKELIQCHYLNEITV